MDANFNNRRPKKAGYVVLIGIALLIVVSIGVIAFFMKGSSMITPVPPQPSFKVIFISPTVGAVSPTSTPSATIRPSATAKPVKPTSTATPSATVVKVSPTARASLTPTVKP